jgi:Flp pilus assembly protein TadD
VDTPPGGSLGDHLLSEVRALDADTVFFLAPGTVTPPGWTSALEAALSGEDVGCALAMSNKGLGEDRVEPSYRKLGKPLARFATRHQKQWKGRVGRIEVGFPAALAVRRSVLLEHGLGKRFRTPAILLDLQRRLTDGGLSVICVKETYVHAADVANEEVAAEMEAVLLLFAARKCIERGDTAGAMMYLNQVLEAKSDYPEGLYERGLIFSLIGRRRDAVADFERLLELEPSDSRAANNLGCLHFEMGDQAAAECRFREAIRTDAGNWEAKKNLADLLLRASRSDEAIDLYSSVIQEHGDRPGVYVSVAEVFANLGDLESAEHLFEMGLRVSPEDEGARRGLLAVRSAMRGRDERERS